MNQQVETMKLALEALDIAAYGLYRATPHFDTHKMIEQVEASITTIKRAFSSPVQEQAEQLAKLGWQAIECPFCGSSGAQAFAKPATPVPLTEWQQIAEDLRFHGLTLVNTATGYAVLKLASVQAQTTPPAAQREWVELTDEEIVSINDQHYNIAFRDFDADVAIARAIEAAHGIKENT